jgi:hypothetical protein
MVDRLDDVEQAIISTRKKKNDLDHLVAEICRIRDLKKKDPTCC